MTSLFFNVSHSRYKVSTLAQTENEHIQKVDISSGLVFFDLSLFKHREKKIDIKNPDKMVSIVVMKKGNATIFDNKEQKNHTLKENNIYLFSSSKQDFSLTLLASNTTEIFVLFIADFILKRYLSCNPKEPIDYLYQQTQNNHSLNLINKQPLDALTLYLIRRIKESDDKIMMRSILGEHRVIEFMMHRFLLLDILDEEIEEGELQIALRAKKHLLEHFVSPPTIPKLAHICATNESKLKRSFKKVHKMTLYAYIQKLRLEKANILLIEQSLSVGEIAKKVGYQHQGNFSKLFFKTYGVYPKELLKT